MSGLAQDFLKDSKKMGVSHGYDTAFCLSFDITTI